jgi:hypothetical protein
MYTAFHSISIKNVGYELTDCKACDRDFIGSEQIGNLPAIKGIISWWQEVQYQ